MARPPLGLGKQFSLQLSKDAEAFFQAKADAASIPLGAYLRMVLQDVMKKQLQKQEDTRKALEKKDAQTG